MNKCVSYPDCSGDGFVFFSGYGGGGAGARSDLTDARLVPDATLEVVVGDAETKSRVAVARTGTPRSRITGATGLSVCVPTHRHAHRHTHRHANRHQPRRTINRGEEKGEIKNRFILVSFVEC